MTGEQFEDAVQSVMDASLAMTPADKFRQAVALRLLDDSDVLHWPRVAVMAACPIDEPQNVQIHYAHTFDQIDEFLPQEGSGEDRRVYRAKLNSERLKLGFAELS